MTSTFSFLLLIFLHLLLAYSQDKTHKDFTKQWGTFRPDLIYEYSSLDLGMAFGIIYHSNQKLDLDGIERWNHLEKKEITERSGRQKPVYALIPTDMERMIRYEKNEKVHTDYKVHDGSQYLQKIIQEEGEIVMNIKTLRNNYHWESLLSVQRPNITESLNHTLYFYFICEKSNCLTVQSEAENGQQSIKIQTSNGSGQFKLENLKEASEMRIRVIQEDNFQVGSSKSEGNVRRVLQNDILYFLDKNEDIGNIVIVRVKIIGSTKGIFRINYQSQQNEQQQQQLSQIVASMKEQENLFYQQVKNKLLSSYSQIHPSVLETTSQSISNILGSIFLLHHKDKQILGIMSSQSNKLIPSLYDDGYTIRAIALWNSELAHELLLTWKEYRNIQGYSLIDNEDVGIELPLDFKPAKMRERYQSAPSIMIPIQYLINIYKKAIKLDPTAQDSLESKIEELVEFSEDILFNLLFNSNKEQTQNEKDSLNQGFRSRKTESSKKVFDLKWYKDQQCECYHPCGNNGNFNNNEKQAAYHLRQSVDYIAWTYFTADILFYVAKSNPNSEIETHYYSDIKLNLEVALNQELQPSTSTKLFKDLIQYTNSTSTTFSTLSTLSNTYPFLFGMYPLNQEEISQDESFQLIINELSTKYGISAIEKSFFKQSQPVNQKSTSYPYSDCYEKGDISLIQNYLVLKGLYFLQEDNQEVKQAYDTIFNDVIENVFKHFSLTNKVFEVYSKNNGDPKGKCRQLAAMSVFLLIINEDYS